MDDINVDERIHDFTIVSDLSLLAAPGMTTGVLTTAPMAITLTSEGSESQRPKHQLLLKSLAHRVSPFLCHKVSRCVWVDGWMDRQSLQKKKSFCDFWAFFKNVLCSELNKEILGICTNLVLEKQCDMIGFARNSYKSSYSHLS